MRRLIIAALAFNLFLTVMNGVIGTVMYMQHPGHVVAWLPSYAAGAFCFWMAVKVALMLREDRV